LQLSRREGLSTNGAAITAQALSGRLHSVAAAPVAIGYNQTACCYWPRRAVQSMLRSALPEDRLRIGSNSQWVACAPLVHLAALPITGLSSAILIHRNSRFGCVGTNWR